MQTADRPERSLAGGQAGYDLDTRDATACSRLSGCRVFLFFHVGLHSCLHISRLRLVDPIRQTAVTDAKSTLSGLLSICQGAGRYRAECDKPACIMREMVGTAVGTDRSQTDSGNSLGWPVLIPTSVPELLE